MKQLLTQNLDQFQGEGSHPLDCVDEESPSRRAVRRPGSDRLIYLADYPGPMAFADVQAGNLGRALWGLGGTLLWDFVLGFAFFFALCFAVLSRKFDQQRAAAVMSAAMGLALAVGLVWWEAQHDYSMRQMGTLAVGIIVITLGVVLYQALKRVGGMGAGAGLALGASLLVGWSLGMEWPIDPDVVRSIAFAAVIVGVLLLVLHRHGDARAQPSMQSETAAMGGDLRRLYWARCLADRVGTRLDHLRDELPSVGMHPQRVADVMLQLSRILPEVGQLTHRLAELRAKAHRMRAGHVARIGELRGLVDRLPPEQKAKVAHELTERFKELQFDTRLERLDRAAAENERRVQALTRQAQAWLQSHDYRRVSTVLDEAATLQHHNARLLQAVERTEARLLSAAQQAAKTAVAADA